MEKSQCFVSAVIYLDEKDHSLKRLEELIAIMEEQFDNYELVLVDDGMNPNLSQQLSTLCAREGRSNMTLIRMGKKQGLERSMNAGIDCAIGDFILEVDDLGSLDPSFLPRAYDIAVSSNNDIVLGESERPSLQGAVFYPLFNKFNDSEINIGSGSCSFVSRRAVNRVHAMSEYLPYRKAAYASSGLSVTTIRLEQTDRTRKSSLGLAVDSLAIYTDFFYKASFTLATTMAIISILELIYTITVSINGYAIEGWSTIMLALSFGLFGLFSVQAFVLKYLSLLVSNIFKKKSYFVESIKRL